MVGRLWQVGIDRIFVDGSFVEEKDHPNDIDGYFECDVRYFASGQLQRDLNALEGADVWTWDPARRIPDPSSGSGSCRSGTATASSSTRISQGC